MVEQFLIGLASIIVLGIGSQWLAWRLHLPSILLLLLMGFIAGPVTNFLQPDMLFGGLLIPFVSISVALILFEGGLSLKISELRETSRVVTRLVTVGALVTWALGAWAAYALLGLSGELAILLGAILIVTGPTVIGPLLRHIRPTRQVASILKWEGIVIDPIGAVVSLLAFEALLVSETHSVSLAALTVLSKTIIVGTVLGVLGAGLLIVVLKRYWVPDFLQETVTLMVVIGVYVSSGLLQEESGLLAVTLMGVLLANQKTVSVVHIVEFKENLRVLLISSLFILLAARLKLDYLAELGWNSVIFLIVLMLVARPLAVLISSARTRVTWRERALLMWIAPRGIVAASVISIFAVRLSEVGYTQASQLVPLTFLVIVGTAAVYGLTARPLAKALGVAQLNPQGVLFMGAHPWARDMAKVLQDEGFRVRLVDTNWHCIAAARMAGLPVHYGSAIAEDSLDRLDLNGIGRLLALTPNDEANSLAALHFLELFGREELFQLSPTSDPEETAADYPPLHLRGRFLFGPGASYQTLSELKARDAVIKKTVLTDTYDFNTFQQQYGGSALPLFLIDQDRKLRVFTHDENLVPESGQVLISMVEDPESISLDKQL
ncbi:MAG: sodium:proton antiporter [Fidelibacterota bacterium]|nr:MAG: sodium:proton antiporter [Candidatus Neomarinimicrobiota bacterium]